MKKSMFVCPFVPSRMNVMAFRSAHMSVRAFGAVLLAVSLGGAALAQGGALVVVRKGRTISLEPYAPNILRITMSTDRAAATGPPGYGFVAKPSADGWTHDRDAEGNDIFRSARMVVRVAQETCLKDKLPQPMPLDALNLQLREQYFGGGRRRNGPHNDALLVTTAAGKTLLHMRTWTMEPESAEVAAADAGAKGYRVAATFDSPADEHYYGLGQQQKGWMDLRDHEIRCWHDYGAIGGEDVCVPFLVSSLGYGLVWDNPSKTTVDLGFNGRNVWSSEVGDRVSYFVIAGDTSDEIYEGYRLLTGVTHMLPRGGLWVYPEQGNLPDAGTDSGCGQGVSREEIAAGCDRGRLSQHDEAGRNGPGPEALARSGSDESRAACDGRKDAVECVAALFARDAVLRHAAEQRLADSYAGRKAGFGRLPSRSSGRISTRRIRRQRIGFGRRFATVT